MEKMPNPEHRAPLPVHARTSPTQGAGIKLRLFNREKALTSLGGTATPPDRGSASGQAPSPLDPVPSAKPEPQGQMGAGTQGGLPLSLRSGSGIQIGPFMMPALCGTWRSKINQTRSLPSMSSPWGLGETDKQDAPSSTPAEMAEEGTGRLGPRREGAARPGEVREGAPRRS